MTATVRTSSSALGGGQPRQRVPDSKVGGVTFGHVVHSEVTKLYTLRSVLLGLVIAGLLIIGVGVFMAIGIAVQHTAPTGTGARPAGDPTGASLSGVSWAMFAVAAVGVVAVTSEYASGTIQGTFTAVPRRTMIVFGKSLALAMIAGIGTVASTLIAFLVAKAVLATEGLIISLAEPGVARSVIGSGLYLTGVTLMAAGFGWLLRSTAGALAVVLVVLIVVPIVGFLLPPAVRDAVVPYLPNNAGTAIMQVAPSGMLPPWTGLGVFALYTAAVLVTAALVVRLRDV
jgi:ABC-2 type transport system permease protein